MSDRYREWMVEADPVKRKAIYAAELAADPRNAEKEPPKRGKKPVNQKRKADRASSSGRNMQWVRVEKKD